MRIASEDGAASHHAQISLITDGVNSKFLKEALVGVAENVRTCSPSSTRYSRPAALSESRWGVNLCRMLSDVVLVPGTGLEPVRSCLRGIFLPTTAFAAEPSEEWLIWSLDFLFAVSARECPRS